jgi:type I restriction enzyme M protein
MLAEIAEAGYALTPGRYVGTSVDEEDEQAFEERIAELVAQIREDFAENERLTAEVRRALGAVKYGP